MNFTNLPLIPPLQKALEKVNFTIPTQIQAEVIPFALEGKDILGSAQTGSGKTLAFALPILQNLYHLKKAKGTLESKERKILSLILAPTRELAIQIGETFAPYATNVNMKYTVIYGGVNQFHQVQALKRGVDILIATPGRLEDLISQGFIKLSYIEILTLDEADKMLDMGFLPDVKKVIKRIPQTKQTFFFSATMPPPIKELSNSILNNPEEITVHTVSSTTDTIDQQVYHIASSNKRKLLQQIVKRRDLSSILVFVKTKDDTEFVMEYVKSARIACDNIHRNRSQNARQRSIQALKDGKIKVLIATDIAARGIDIENLSCVVNYNIPSDPEAYVHRIGRTGRAGKKGRSISLCTDADKENFEKIEALIGKKIPVSPDDSYKKEEIPKGEYLGRFSFDEDGKKSVHSRRKPEQKKYYGKKKK